MNHLNLNKPLSIFTVGAILFLLAPVIPFDSYTVNEIFIAGILMQLAGITAAVIVFFRYKITERCLKEI
jgi:hypothetical protein